VLQNRLSTKLNTLQATLKEANLFPWSRILLVDQIIGQLFNKFLTFYVPTGLSLMPFESSPQAHEGPFQCYCVTYAKMYQIIPPLPLTFSIKLFLELLFPRTQFISHTTNPLETLIVFS
jgi:hypothetical protein